MNQTLTQALSSADSRAWATAYNAELDHHATELRTGASMTNCNRQTLALHDDLQSKESMYGGLERYQVGRAIREDRMKLDLHFVTRTASNMPFQADRCLFLSAVATEGYAIQS